jgi:DNA-binding transcriptional regulator YhcF (GntR family)
MFVAKGAKKKLVEKRKKAFSDEFVVPLIQEAEKLGISENEIIELIMNREGK